MKKLLLIVLTVSLNLALFSCTPDKIIEETTEVQACCDDEGTIELPPPPPPPADDYED